MRDAHRQHAINKAKASYWKERIEYWLICQEFDLKKGHLDSMALECAIEALNSAPYRLAALRQRLLHLGATEDEIANPNFFGF